MRYSASLFALSLLAFAAPAHSGEIRWAHHRSPESHVPIETPDGMLLYVHSLTISNSEADSVIAVRNEDGERVTIMRATLNNPARNFIVPVASAELWNGTLVYEFIPKGRQPSDVETHGGKARVILESSVDGVNWAEAEPGVYDDGPGRLFRVRVVPVVTPASE